MEINEPVKEQQNKKKPFMRKYIIAAGFILLFIFVALVLISLNCEPKSDPASEAIIRNKVARIIFNSTGVEKDPNNLTDEDFKQMDVFALGHSIGGVKSGEIADIKLLERFTEMKEFTLGNVTYPKDKIPEWMIVLEKFGVFDLKEKFALDLSPLRNMTNLQELFIIETSVKNINVLSSLTNLKLLFLSNSNISNLEPLKNLVNLQELIINGSEISDLRPLMGLKNLKRLNIISCKNINDKQIDDLQQALPELKIRR
jgi:hypothetical protein